MEARSWKGTGGTALLCNEEDATFARHLIWNLAEQENASVALLWVDREPIAAQVLLYCGITAYTWKTAFISEFGKYSPGGVLIDRITEQLFSTTNVAAIDSCSPEGSFMAQLWDGRRTTVDMMADVGTTKSLHFIMAAMAEREFLQLRGLRDRLRAVSWSPPKRRNLAASQ